uniref:Uncharacterized protein n=1 Tax=Romanomermis culicivorax TaxID=13658 RepID=A0A915K547_ROMCU
RYISYQKKQHCQDNRFFFAEEFERWFETVYTRPLNVLGDPTYVKCGDLKNTLMMHSKPNFGSHVLVGFDVQKISTNQLYIHKKT